MRHHRLDCLIRMRRERALRKRDGALKSETESEECAMLLEGVTVPTVEKCPYFTASE